MLLNHKFIDPDGNGFLRVHSSEDFDFQNPIKYYAATSLNLAYTMACDILIARNVPFTKEIEIDARKKAAELWALSKKQIEETIVPDYLIDLLKTEKKIEQLRLLKGADLTPIQLIAFIFKAWKEFGYSLSQHSAEHHHIGFNRSAMPKAAHVSNGILKVIGKTTLSPGQIKHAIMQRKYVVAKFLDKGVNWHCFFLTFKSLRGEETWEGGQPHYHYISDKFGFKRHEVIKQLKSRNYNLGSLPHINLLDFGTQPKK